jgi:hypothetical protein
VEIPAISGILKVLPPLFSISFTLTFDVDGIQWGPLPLFGGKPGLLNQRPPATVLREQRLSKQRGCDKPEEAVGHGVVVVVFVQTLRQVGSSEAAISPKKLWGTVSS